MPCFYRRKGDLFAPTGLALSPWEPDKQNGIALGGLATFLVEAIPTLTPMTTARITIDILGAAPHAATLGHARIVRDGKRVQLVEAELSVAGRVVTRISALRVRKAESPAIAPIGEYPLPDTLPDETIIPPKMFGGSLTTRPVRGSLDQPGSAATWVRFGHQHIEGVPLSPLIGVVSLADFGGGLGRAIDPKRWSYPNLDIAVHLMREPVGEWLLADASTESAGLGVGLSDMRIADVHGAVARAHQTLFISPRG